MLDVIKSENYFEEDSELSWDSFAEFIVIVTEREKLMNNKIAQLFITLFVMLAGIGLCDEVERISYSIPLKLDLRTGVRESEGVEEIVYSPLWAGEAGSTITITVNGQELQVNRDEDGVIPWKAIGAGRYDFEHTTVKNGNEVEKLQASFIVSHTSVVDSETDEPGDGTMPVDGLSEYDTESVYDGKAHTIATNALGQVVIGGVKPMVTYSLSAEGPWASVAPGFVNAGATSVWYKLSVPNYSDYTHEVRVSITEKALTDGMVGAIADVVYTGSALEPSVTVTDGTPSIVTTDDYTVTYENNVNVGTATAVVTGMRNYAGVVRKEFAITEAATDLSGAIKWRLNKGTGTYFAQLKLTVIAGNAGNISDLRFVFADRVKDSKVYSSLWCSRDRSAVSTTMEMGAEGLFGRYVELDGALLVDGSEVYGLSDETLSATTSVPSSERLIELYVRKRVSPVTGNETDAEVENFVGYLTWNCSTGRKWLPVVESPSFVLMRFGAVKSAMSVAALNIAAGLQTAASENLTPECEITDFTVVGNRLVGRCEVSALRGEMREKVESLGNSARIVVYGAKGIGNDFVELKSASVDLTKREFSVDVEEGYRFFKVVLVITDVVE